MPSGRHFSSFQLTHQCQVGDLCFISPINSPMPSGRPFFIFPINSPMPSKKPLFHLSNQLTNAKWKTFVVRLVKKSRLFGSCKSEGRKPRSCTTAPGVAGSLAVFRAAHDGLPRVGEPGYFCPLLGSPTRKPVLKGITGRLDCKSGKTFGLFFKLNGVLED